MHKAIIADDEKALRSYLTSMLKEVWPELNICGEAANGKEAMMLIESEEPDIAFLDIRMPGLSGMQVAKEIAGACHVVFVTAYDEYAVEAFERQAVDYLLKPVSKERLAMTIARLKERLQSKATPSPDTAAFLEKLLSGLSGVKQSRFLKWIRAQHKDGIRLIPVEEVDYFKAEDKYTLVMTNSEESLIKKSIRELASELDPMHFWQIHRAVIVNASRIEKVTRSLTGRGIVKMKGRPEELVVSRNYLHLFKQM
jgi:DNA-binding LytR/AlgR family response regulator